MLGSVGALALAVPVVFYIVTQGYTYHSLDSVPSAQVALVLGASVVGKNILSPILQQRVDAAILLYRAHKVSKILMSGDNATLSYDEVEPVRRYLLFAGVAPQDIFLDHAGFDTYSSMYRAHTVFDVSSMIITSQSFHLPRAIFIARALNIETYGFTAPGGGWFNTLREIPASDKAFFDVLFARIPRYLGAQFPITSDGQSTWQ